MSDLFSFRNRPAPANLRLDLPLNARNRIIQNFRVMLTRENDFPWSVFQRVMHDVLLMAHGSLSGHPSTAIDDFKACSNDHAMDWIELAFQGCPLLGRQGIAVVNGIFREEHIGYAITNYVFEGDDQDIAANQFERGGNVTVLQHPQIVKRSDEFTHQQIVEPALKILSNPKFKNANDELLAAMKHLRHGDRRDAIVRCCAAFETVLKTICDSKGWPFDPNRDTVSKLVGHCKTHQLFFDFYGPILENIGTIRNRMGGHGMGNAPDYEPEDVHVEHMIQTTAANIIFLANLAA